MNLPNDVTGVLLHHSISPVERADIREFYWHTNIPVLELIEAYGLCCDTNYLTLRVIAGPLNVGRCSCGGEILLFSRIERERHEAKRHPQRKLLCDECLDRRNKEWSKQQQQQNHLEIVRINELRTMPYGDYLRTPEWCERRAKAIKRASGRCQLCSSGRRLNVHHRTYSRRGAEYDSDLIVLCEECHHQFHERQALAEGGRAG